MTIWIIPEGNVAETPQWRQEAWAGDASSGTSGEWVAPEVTVSEGWRVVHVD